MLWKKEVYLIVKDDRKCSENS